MPYQKQTTGSRAQVMHGTAKKTTGGLTKSQLKYNKQGKIVSKKASALAKKNNRLVKAGFVTEKGKFGVSMRGGSESASELKGKLDRLIIERKCDLSKMDKEVTNDITKQKNSVKKDEFHFMKKKCGKGRFLRSKYVFTYYYLIGSDDSIIIIGPTTKSIITSVLKSGSTPSSNTTKSIDFNFPRSPTAYHPSFYAGYNKMDNDIIISFLNYLYKNMKTIFTAPKQKNTFSKYISIEYINNSSENSRNAFQSSRKSIPSRRTAFQSSRNAFQSRQNAFQSSTHSTNYTSCSNYRPIKTINFKQMQMDLTHLEENIMYNITLQKNNTNINIPPDILSNIHDLIVRYKIRQDLNNGRSYKILLDNCNKIKHKIKCLIIEQMQKDLIRLEDIVSNIHDLIDRYKNKQELNNDISYKILLDFCNDIRHQIEQMKQVKTSQHNGNNRNNRRAFQTIS